MGACGDPFVPLAAPPHAGDVGVGGPVIGRIGGSGGSKSMGVFGDAGESEDLGVGGGLVGACVMTPAGGTAARCCCCCCLWGGREGGRGGWATATFTGLGAGILVSDVTRRLSVGSRDALSADALSASSSALATASSSSFTARAATSSSSSRRRRCSSSTLNRSSASSARAASFRLLSSSTSRAISSRSARSAASRASFTSLACRRLSSLVCLATWRRSSASFVAASVAGERSRDDLAWHSSVLALPASVSLVASLGLRDIMPHDAHIHRFPAGFVCWLAKGASHWPQTFTRGSPTFWPAPRARDSSASMVFMQCPVT
mmetsp:Transcript_4978/g.13247  ORF Transcript_4978/g.13247 Transcript_4978/m.13247 type:complete len:318 (-) Transcript_4978:490-1443(-)